MHLPQGALCERWLHLRGSGSLWPLLLQVRGLLHLLLLRGRFCLLLASLQRLLLLLSPLLLPLPPPLLGFELGIARLQDRVKVAPRLGMLPLQLHPCSASHDDTHTHEEKHT